MDDAYSELRERYRTALETYIGRNAEDSALVDVLGIGRAALAEGRGLIDLLSIHQTLVPSLISGLSSPAEIAAIVTRCDEFLSEVIAPFEMTHRGWHDVVGRLHRLNETLEQQVLERTKALQDSERRFQDIAEVSGDWMWETDREHRFTVLQGKRTEDLPVPPDGLFGRTRWEIAGADPKTDAFWGGHKTDLDAHRPFRQFHYELQAPEGGRMFVSASGKPVFDEDGEFLGYRGTATDESATVAVRRQAEAAEALLRDAIESISGGVLICDAEDRIVLFNERFRKSFEGCTETLKPGSRYEDFLLEAVQRGCYPGAVGREDAWRAERLARHHEADTEIEVALRGDRWVLVTDRRMSNGGIALVSADITALKEAQKALMDREARLNRAQRVARTGSDVRDLRTGEREWSDETYRIFGVSRETFAITPDNVFDLVHSEDRPAVIASRAKTAVGLCPEPFEHRIVRPDGEVRHIYREWELIRDDSGNPAQLLGTIQDITERRRTEEQLRQAQKMEAIGNLTGGMAHDFNNLLGIIIGNLDLAGEYAKGSKDADELVEEALEAAWRGADLTRRLLAFSRRQPLRPVQLDINDLVANTVRLLGRLLGEDIEVELALAEGLWPVTVDPAQLEASLANLATNARDAMPDGGQLIIRTHNARLDADYVASHADVAEGDFVMIEVSDTGTGMSAETMSHVFEPFFTTKELGKGTGLGLSMVFGFLRQSGGHVNVYSEPGVGTTFRLYLPKKIVEAVQEEVPVDHAEIRGVGESILVVEDNAAMRRIVLRRLRDLGYRVFEADRATAALDVLQREPIDLLFTDVVMPGGLDGTELARLARERRPALKVVLTSGFPDVRAKTTRGWTENFRLLGKPYSKEELARTLREALAS